MRYITTLSIGAVLAVPPFILSGCAVDGTRAADGVPHAECPVCRKNGDLACLIVKVTPVTPRAEFEGRTYYFCSSGCREDFERSPERYASGTRPR